MGALESQGIRTHRLTVEAYHRMGAAGVFAPEARVELIQGEVVEMASIGSRHASVVRRLNRRLGAAAGSRAIVSVQDPVQLDDGTEPQPDLALLAPHADFYRERHPRAGETLLVIEVADTTLRYDRDIKVPLYAAAGVPEVWVVDIESQLITLYRHPLNGTYRHVQTMSEGDSVALMVDSSIVVDLANLF